MVSLFYLFVIYVSAFVSVSDGKAAAMAGGAGAIARAKGKNFVVDDKLKYASYENSYKYGSGQIRARNYRKSTGTYVDASYYGSPKGFWSARYDTAYLKQTYYYSDAYKASLTKNGLSANAGLKDAISSGILLYGTKSNMRMRAQMGEYASNYCMDFTNCDSEYHEATVCPIYPPVKMTLGSDGDTLRDGAQGVSGAEQELQLAWQLCPTVDDKINAVACCSETDPDPSGGQVPSFCCKPEYWVGGEPSNTFVYILIGIVCVVVVPAIVMFTVRVALRRRGAAAPSARGQGRSDAAGHRDRRLIADEDNKDRAESTADAANNSDRPLIGFRPMPME